MCPCFLTIVLVFGSIFKNISFWSLRSPPPRRTTKRPTIREASQTHPTCIHSGVPGVVRLRKSKTDAHNAVANMCYNGGTSVYGVGPSIDTRARVVFTVGPFVCLRRKRQTQAVRILPPYLSVICLRQETKDGGFATWGMIVPVNALISRFHVQVWQLPRNR